jgi:ferritin-like metal-binding protein YciE
MAEMTKRDATLARYLNEAYVLERRLELALEAHLEVTTRPQYAQRLKRHLAETRSHASKVERRIKGLGGTPETVSLPAPEGLVDKLESAQGVVQRAAAAVQSSLHAVRRTGERELMLKNARAEFREEAEEIATYRMIDGLATAVGDRDTAKLAREILRQEERMAAYLGDLIPELAMDVAHDEVPVSEIEGPAAHRTAAAGAHAATSRRAKGGSSRTRAASRRAGGSTTARARARRASGARATSSTARRSGSTSRRGGRRAGGRTRR